MAYQDLRDFLKRLDMDGELARVSAEIDPVYEVTELSDRTVKAGGPACSSSGRGHKMPVVTNLVGH